jgi:hypothetical protein
MESLDEIVNSARKGACRNLEGRNARSSVLGPGLLVWLGLSLLAFALPSPGQPQSPQSSMVQTPGTEAGNQVLPDQQLPGGVSGSVVDGSGAAVVGARVTLTHEDPSSSQEARTGDDGQFSFTDIAPGSFHLAITATGFATQNYSGILRPGQVAIVPQLALALATAVTEVQVVAPRTELAEDQIKVQEKQRVLGVVPNFYVSYVPDAVPLSSKQKFELGWKTILDPFTFGLIGAVAGVEQAQNAFSGYGQGAQGYAKRYGAGFADNVSGLLIGNAILPSLLKQDPRYFYKGTGSRHSRILYAIASSVICKGDDGRNQADYSSILGSLAAGGLSNLYYPAKDRNGAALTFETAAIGIGETAAFNLFQEFVSRKVTPKLPHHDSARP